MFKLSEEIAIDIIQTALADGQTDPVSDNVDMQGWDGVLLVGMPGTITGSGTVTLTATQAATDTAGNALSGAAVTATAAAQSDKLLPIDLFQPEKRFIGATLTRAVANSTYNGTLAIRYKARSRPTTWTAAMLADSVALTRPAEA